MKYNRTIVLKNGKECLLRNAEAADGAAVYENFNLTHGETDYLLTYPDEKSFTIEQETEFLAGKAESEREAEIIAIVDDEVVATAGISSIGGKYKIRHRAEFGVSVAKKYWGLGIGKALLSACVECAKKAGYVQLELDVVADNSNAIRLYEEAGFVEYGRNPKGFNSRVSGFQELVHMRLEL